MTRFESNFPKKVITLSVCMREYSFSFSLSPATQHGEGKFEIKLCHYCVYKQRPCTLKQTSEGLKCFFARNLIYSLCLYMNGKMLFWDTFCGIRKHVVDKIYWLICSCLFLQWVLIAINPIFIHIVTSTWHNFSQQK